MADDTEVVLNGIDGATGDYLEPPLPEKAAAELVASERADTEKLNILRQLHKQATRPTLGLAFDLDPTKVEEAGWGIVFHKDEEAGVKNALHKLVVHRSTQISNPSIVKTLEYLTGETVPRWLARHGVGLGTIDPERVPFYLLIVGSPERIPFEFGHLLDVEYAVGRLHFDTATGYTAYVDSLVEYETGSSIPNGRDVLFFGPMHPGDPATQLSAEALVKPLAEGSSGGKSVVERVAARTGVAYRTTLHLPEESTKRTLRDAFHTPAAQPSPTFVFTASHGVGWPPGHPRQSSAQGALLCQDFPGRGRGALTPDHYFAAADLAPDARVHGIVCFHFACYGAGTPKHDRFFHTSGQPRQIASESFFSALPKALLSHANGGALGVIGHVERAWASSIVSPDAGPQLLPFENTLGYILSGRPLGYSIKDFNERYAALSTNLGALLEMRAVGVAVPDRELAARWSERNDAEAYVLFGDPAVRLRTDALLD